MITISDDLENSKRRGMVKQGESNWRMHGARVCFQYHDLLAWTHKCFEDALILSSEEKQLRAELNEWLPDLIIDCHAHANGTNAVKKLPRGTLERVHSSFPDFGIEDSLRMRRVLYFGKKVHTLRFSNPYRGIDHRSANAYLTRNSPIDDQVALCGLPDDLSYTVNEIYSGDYTALKMHPFYFEPPAQTISKCFPDEILMAAQHAGLPIILHVPVPLSSCLGQVLEMTRRFPKLAIILAHLGRERKAAFASLAAYEALLSHPRIVGDVSMVSSSQVITQALNVLGPERILFGSDEPFNLLRYVSYQHPQLGERYVSQYPYHWLDEEQRQEYGHLAKNAVHLHWQVLLAVKMAIAETYPYDADAVKNSIFSENAQRVFPNFHH